MSCDVKYRSNKENHKMFIALLKKVREAIDIPIVLEAVLTAPLMPSF